MLCCRVSNVFRILPAVKPGCPLGNSIATWIKLVNLDPTIGSEIKKTRLCVVISPDEMNMHLRVIVIAPMTTTSRNYPTRVEIKHDNKLGSTIRKKMKKEISFSTQGQRADIANMTIYRLLPNRYADAIGPFVFLDHIAPKILTSVNKEGTGPNPHRGIATLSYILNGEDEHIDSTGNYANVHSGGVNG